MSVLLLCSPDEHAAAQRLADQAGLALAVYQQHRFPDQELKLTLPFTDTLPQQLVLAWPWPHQTTPWCWQARCRGAAGSPAWVP